MQIKVPNRGKHFQVISTPKRRKVQKPTGAAKVDQKKVQNDMMQSVETSPNLKPFKL